MVLNRMAADGHEHVSYFVDEETGLRAIVAIHDTTLGPSLGGTRMRDYETEADALNDVLRLSRGMTYKAAAADLDLGGGKAVIVGDPETKTEEMMAAYGRFVDRLDGEYITSVDMNTGVDDMDVIAEQTDHVVGVSDGLGDPSPVTSTGALSGLKASAEWEYGSPELDGRTVLIQGAGKVGGRLAELLAERGATVKVSDVHEEKVQALVDDHGVEAVPTDDVYSEPCDIFAPCAIGGVINDDTIPQLECDIVAGSANNILRDRRHAEALEEAGILYAPDYVLNAGGLITVAQENKGGTMDDAIEAAEAIGDRLLNFFERAEGREITTLDAAEAYAEERIDEADERTAISAD